MMPITHKSGVPWTGSESGRVPPRECIRAARDALNKAYSHPGITDGRHAVPFIAEAVDWQRRALEQMAGGDGA
jgi:hypothetical protein